MKENILSEDIEKIKNINNGDIDIFSLEGEEKIGKVVDIYDADTCKIVFILDNKYVKFNCRLNGIDAPELRQSKKNPNRIAEKKAAQIARNRLIQLCTDIDLNIEDKLNRKKKKKLMEENKKIIKIKCKEFDKYGRLLVDLYSLENNEYINHKLIDEVYVNQYSGGKKQIFKFNQIAEIDSDTDIE